MVTGDAIPSWARKVLRDDAHSRVTDAVRAVEATTSGEIVPMVVARSAAFGHVQALVTATLLVVALLVADFVATNAWITAAALAVAVGLGWLLARLDPVRRVFTPAADLEAQVMRRAALEFYEAGLRKTAGATGILLFVSVAEHRAVVLADESIAAKLPPEAWKGVVDLMLAGVRRGDLGQGLVDAVRQCGTLVTPHFPVAPDDVNELADALVIKS